MKTKYTEIRIVRHGDHYVIEFCNSQHEIYYQTENVDIYDIAKAMQIATYDQADEMINGWYDARTWGLAHGTSLRDKKIVEVLYRIKESE